MSFDWHTCDWCETEYPPEFISSVFDRMSHGGGDTGDSQTWYCPCCGNPREW